MVNAEIHINSKRLNFPLETLHARKLHSFTATVLGIPRDCGSLTLRVFAANGQSYADAPIGVDPYGIGSSYLLGTYFPAVGQLRYEIHAFDVYGNATALGEGLIDVADFSLSGTPVTPGEEVLLDRIRDRQGQFHTITAVPDGAGGYTTVVDFIEEN